MGRKQISRLYSVATDADMSAPITSEATDVEQYDLVSYCIDWAGTGSTGTFEIQVSSEDHEKDAIWKPLDFGTTIAVASDSDSHEILMRDIHFKRVRVVYTPTAGTGLMQIKIKSGTKGA